MNGFKIIKSDEAIEPKKLTVTLFGTPGIGKTSLSFTMPGPVLFLDFDKGIQRAVQKIRPDYIAVSEFEPFLEWIESAEFSDYIKDGGYQSVVLDTIGTLLDDYAAGYVKKQDFKNRTSTGSMALPGWGALKDLFNDRIKNRFQNLGLHICFIAHDKDLGDSSPVKIGLSISGGSSDIVERVSDLMGYVYAEGTKRVVNFSAAQQLHKAKDSAGIGKVEIPEAKKIQYDTFLADIIRRTQKKMMEGSMAQIAAREKVDQYRQGIAECTDAADFKDMMAKIEEEIGAVKAQAGHLFRDRLKEVGLTYDAKEGFIPVTEKQKA